MKTRRFLSFEIDDFKTIRNEQYYYVDKTMLVAELLKKKQLSVLFLTGYKSGKTVNMTMLKYFFDIRNREKNKRLFKGLKISETEYISEQGNYPVIFISLKDLKGDKWENYFNELKKVIKKLYSNFPELKNQKNSSFKEEYEKIVMEKSDADWSNSLKKLVENLFEYYSQKVIILVDDYDSPVISGITGKYYNEVMSFFQIFFNSVLKEGNLLKSIIFTGKTRYLEGIISDSDKISISTSDGGDYSEYFDLTEAEMLKMLNFFELDPKSKEFMELYEWPLVKKNGNYKLHFIMKHIDYETPYREDFPLICS